MRARVILPVALLALVVAALAPAQSKGPVKILVTKDGFSPTTVTIKAGEAVTWHNVDATTDFRRVSSPEAGFTSPILRPDQVFTYTFTKVGQYSFFDTVSPSHRGAVGVGVGAASYAVSATASPRVATFGAKVRLSGQVATRRAGQTITVQAKPQGARKLDAIGATVTRSAGKWSFVVKPKLNTEYLAVWAPPGEPRVASRPLPVKVQPALALRVKSSGGSTMTFVVNAHSARSYAGRYVLVQRRSNFGQWVTLRKVTLRGNSSATFSLAVPSGRSTLRVSMPQSQVGAGYVAAAKTLTVSR